MSQNGKSMHIKSANLPVLCREKLGICTIALTLSSKRGTKGEGAFPVCLRFYDADEEFPASLQFLWDATALDFLYYETLWYVMDELTEELTETL